MLGFVGSFLFFGGIDLLVLFFVGGGLIPVSFFYCFTPASINCFTINGDIFPFSLRSSHKSWPVVLLMTCLCGFDVPV